MHLVSARGVSRIKRLLLSSLILLVMQGCAKKEEKELKKLHTYRTMLNQDLAKIVFDLRIKRSAHDQSKEPKEQRKLKREVHELEVREAELKTKLTKLDLIIMEKQGISREDFIKETLLEGTKSHDEVVSKIREEQMKNAYEHVQEGEGGGNKMTDMPAEKPKAKPASGGGH